MSWLVISFFTLFTLAFCVLLVHGASLSMGFEKIEVATAYILRGLTFAIVLLLIPLFIILLINDIPIISDIYK